MRGLKLAWLRIAMAILRVCTLFYRDLDVQQCKRVDVRVVPTGGDHALPGATTSSLSQFPTGVTTPDGPIGDGSLRGPSRTLAINDLYECTRAPPWDL